MDSWNASSLELGGALQRAIAGERALLTLRAAWSWLNGDARLAGDDTSFYRATESTLRSLAELRWQPDAAAWQLLAGIAVTYERRDRGYDAPNALHTNIETLTAQPRGEVLRGIARNVAVSAGYALTNYAPRGSMPGPHNYPAAIRPLVGPEAAFYGTPNLAHAGSLAALWQVRPATALRLAATFERQAPRTGAHRLELAPEGTHRSWGVSLSTVIR